MAECPLCIQTGSALYTIREPTQPVGVVSLSYTSSYTAGVLCTACVSLPTTIGIGMPLRSLFLCPRGARANQCGATGDAWRSVATDYLRVRRFVPFRHAATYSATALVCPGFTLKYYICAPSTGHFKQNNLMHPRNQKGR